jgi:hypothetical protein
MAAKKNSKKLRQGKKMGGVKPLTTYKEFSITKYVD